MKRLLYIVHRVPYPPDKGERVRAFHQIKGLAEHFQVTVAALAHSHEALDAADELRKHCHHVLVSPADGRAGMLRGLLSLLTGHSATEGYFRSSRLHRQVATEAARAPFGLVMGSSSGVLPYVLATPAPARVFDLVDVDSAKWLAFARSSRWPKSWLSRREGAAVAELERKAVAECDAVFLVSPDECDALKTDSTTVLPIGNGVDIEYFAPGEGSGEDVGRVDLVFTGQMDYRPNVEGMVWFARHVWPELRRANPEMTWAIVGREPTRAVRQLASMPGVTVTGSVPDVRPYLAAATIAVCPLQTARGIQNKILEAMAMAKPVVASAPSLEGLTLAVGTDALQADTPEEWIRTVGQLAASRDRQESLARAARQCIEKRYTWPAQLRPLISLCKRLYGDEPAALAHDQEASSGADGLAATEATRR